MRAQLGYDRAMQHWTLVLALALLSIFAVSAYAQSNGVPPSVTSYGFGGHRDFGGVPPSVTSVGPNGPGPVRPGPMRPGHTHQPSTITGSIPGHRHHDHANQMAAYPYFIPYYPVVDPYAYGGPDVVQGAIAAAEDPEEPDQYQGGPTIFDRRGAGTPQPNDYARQEARASVPKPDYVPDPPEASVAVVPERPQAPVASQPDTILIFKDGHKQEVGNYAIVGTNLFDLTPGRRQKIALGDLDLPATQKANDDQGIDFKLPELPGGN